MIHFDLPKEKSSIIKVIGVGGGGSNAVNHMNSLGIEGVNFIICNTDAQALKQSTVSNKVQLGPNLTEGLGAGANPIRGKEATEESLEEVKKILEVNTKMVFVTAGMGGGTGTGGAPIVSKVCKEMGILTVGIVTTPFAYEGSKRMAQAKEGIKEMKQYVDTLLVINNDKLRHQFGNLKMSELFAKADNILATAAKCITDVIGNTGQINVDFADVCTVMRDGGVAILGNAVVAGENRAQIAIEEALTSPLLNDNDITGAKWILVNINSGGGDYEHTMDEVEAINSYLVSNAGEGTDVILGLGIDTLLGDKLSVTLIATGFEARDPFAVKEKALVIPQPQKVIHTLGENNSTLPTNVTTPIVALPTVITPKYDAMAPTLTVIEEKVQAIKLFEDDDTVTTSFIKQNTTTNLTTVVPPPTITVIQADTAAVNAEFNYLAKPTNIYNGVSTTVIPTAVPITPPTVQPTIVIQQEPVTESIQMELIYKSEPLAESAPEDKPTLTQTNTHESPVATFANSINANETEDEVDSLTQAAERTKKLRNLSFNLNAADNEQLTNEPAYIRRKTEIHNTLANVEKFYSNYTVNVDDANGIKINENSKNSFLDGEKPD